MKLVARNISFTELHDALIDEKIAAGAYQTASEVVRDAMRLLQERDELHQNRLGQVRAKIEKGWEQSERGQMVEGATVEAHFKKRSADARRKRA
jgi:antitoxin ParD1/3/4